MTRRIFAVLAFALIAVFATDAPVRSRALRKVRLELRHLPPPQTMDLATAAERMVFAAETRRNRNECRTLGDLHPQIPTAMLVIFTSVWIQRHLER